MGYTTDFYGSFTITPPLSPEQVAYINKFSKTRRMGRVVGLAEQYPDPIRVAVGLPIGENGAYYTGSLARCDMPYEDPMTPDVNRPPTGQPGLWCQWVAADDGTELQWDEVEKFYAYVDWLEYLIEHFFTTWGKVIAGKVAWQGEESDDRGTIWAKNNEVRPVSDVISNVNPFSEDTNDAA